MKYIMVLFLMIGTSAGAQKQKVSYHVYDQDWNGINNIDAATYIIEQRNVGDSVFVNRIFLGRGHLWKQESFSDADMTMPNGAFAWYDDNGRIDSSGNVFYKRKDGTWSYYDDTLGVYLSVTYDKGKEISRKDYVKKIITTATGIKTFDEEKMERDTALKKELKVEEKEASIKGGQKGFRNYLQMNLVPPTDILKSGEVKLEFIINKNGKLENPLILKSLQLSADIEALRVISESPDWTPAVQNRRNVIYQAIQNITFQVR